MFALLIVKACFVCAIIKMDMICNINDTVYLVLMANKNDSNYY